MKNDIDSPFTDMIIIQRKQLGAVKKGPKVVFAAGRLTQLKCYGAIEVRSISDFRGADTLCSSAEIQHNDFKPSICQEN